MLPASPDWPADSNNRKSLARSKIRDRRRIRMSNPECARLLASGMKSWRLQVMTTNAFGCGIIEDSRVHRFLGQHATKKKHLVACFFQHARNHVRHVVVEQKTHAIIALVRSLAAPSTNRFRHDDLRNKPGTRKPARE